MIINGALSKSWMVGFMENAAWMITKGTSMN